ncbi:MAG: signal peptidase II [Ruminococcaceae bacterium]|nr:signal peptidase II [Oscillospiraceae bacterium]
MQYVWLLIAALLVGVDRLTKYIVSSNMELEEAIHIIKFGDTEVLNIYYCLNNGAAFSQLKGHKTFLIAVTSVVIAGLLIMMIFKKVKRPLYVAAFGLMLSGGVGNLLDRIFNNGLVVDFIDFRLINFPIFNVADICAVCGAALLLLASITDEIRKKKEKTSELPSDNELSEDNNGEN